MDKPDHEAVNQDKNSPKPREKGSFLLQPAVFNLLLLLFGLILLPLGEVMRDRLFPPFHPVAGHRIKEVVMMLEPGNRIQFQLTGKDARETVKTREIKLTIAEGKTAEERLKAMGILVRYQSAEPHDKALVDEMIYASPAEKAGVYFDDEFTQVMEPQTQPARLLFCLPSLILFAACVMRRAKSKKKGDE